MTSTDSPRPLHHDPVVHTALENTTHTHTSLPLQPRIPVYHPHHSTPTSFLSLLLVIFCGQPAGRPGFEWVKDPHSPRPSPCSRYSTTQGHHPAERLAAPPLGSAAAAASPGPPAAHLGGARACSPGGADWGRQTAAQIAAEQARFLFPRQCLEFEGAHVYRSQWTPSPADTWGCDRHGDEISRVVEVLWTR